MPAMSKIKTMEIVQSSTMQAPDPKSGPLREAQPITSHKEKKGKRKRRNAREEQAHPDLLFLSIMRQLIYKECKTCSKQKRIIQSSTPTFDQLFALAPVEEN